MSSQLVEYKVIFIYLSMEKGAKGGLDWDGGSAIYGFVLFVWGKISAGTLSCLLLQLQY